MKPHSIIGSASYSFANFSPNPVSSGITEVAGVTVDTLTAAGTVVGNFKTPNNFSYRVTKTFYWKGTWLSWHWPTPSMRSNVKSQQIGYLDSAVLPGTPGWERDLMYNRALDKLNSVVRGGLDLSISLAEAGTTARMINAHRRFSDFYQEAEKIWKRKYRLTKTFANFWLEYQYGWRPLVNDIYDAAHEAVRVVLKRIETVQGSATAPLSSFPFSSTIHGVPVKGYATLTGKQGCRISIQYQVPSGQWDLSRWTSLNPVSIAWELMPYSFVVDWFVDVGGYLRNLETALLYSARFVSGFTTELYAVQVNAKANGLGPVLGTSQGEIVQADYMSSDLRFERKVLIAYPFPRVPSFKAQLGPQRLISAAALLARHLPRK